ncbi:DNA-binding protein [Pseudoxanthomonas sp.]|jgi:chromosome segregation ATPase|uniref:DNA-binding protein n=1 Tax=Pseudoxanthomonas sp. TaxID=1871049 RepID=UPI002E115F44|nr:DNA-binding protein [Pseudoxanthomonas sp.]
MARGITESDVHTAADELVAAGERPTVDRIRAHLGTGSPNTVTRWLETWWRGLAPRLHSAQQAIPELPAPVSRLAQQLWEQAVGIARTDAEQAMAQDRLQLDAQRRDLESREGERQAQLRNAADAADQASQALAATQQRLADLQRANNLQQEQIRDLSGQRASLEARSARLEADLYAAQQRATQREESLIAERDAQAQHLRALEDRAHGEIDRARQEAKDVRSQLASLQRTSETLRQQREDAQAATAAAQREAGVQRGRADALAHQLAGLGELPAALQATLAQLQQPQPRPRKASAPPKAQVGSRRRKTSS